MERETLALNIMDIDRRIHTIHQELEALHDMRERLLEEFTTPKLSAKKAKN